MSRSIKQFSDSFEMKSRPLMHPNALILCPNCDFTYVWNSLKLQNHYFLCFIV